MWSRDLFPIDRGGESGEVIRGTQRKTLIVAGAVADCSHMAFCSFFFFLDNKRAQTSPRISIFPDQREDESSSSLSDVHFHLTHSQPVGKPLLIVSDS